jgi:hypothetical protein
LLRAVLSLHRAGLSRLVELLSKHGEVGRSVLRELLLDPALHSLFVLHDLHPSPVAERVAAGLAKVETYLKLNQSRVELVELSEGQRVLLKLSFAQAGCHTSPERLRRAVEEALYESAPDAGVLDIQMEMAS